MKIKNTILPFFLLCLLSINSYHSFSNNYNRAYEQISDKLIVETARCLLGSKENKHWTENLKDAISVRKDFSKLDLNKRLANGGKPKIISFELKDYSIGNNNVKDKETLIKALFDLKDLCIAKVKESTKSDSAFELSNRLEIIILKESKKIEINKKLDNSPTTSSSSEVRTVEENKTDTTMQLPVISDSIKKASEIMNNPPETILGQTDAINQLKNKERIIADLQAQLSRNGFVILNLPARSELKDKPFKYILIFSLLVLLVTIISFFVNRLFKIRKLVSSKMLLDLENKLLLEQKSAENRKEIIVYFATQEWDKRIKKRCSVLSKYNLLFWIYQPEEIKSEFVRKIQKEIPKPEKEENKVAAKTPIVLGNNKKYERTMPSFLLTGNEAKEKFRTIIDEYLTNTQTEKEANKVILHFEHKIDEKINALSLSGFKNKMSYEESEIDFKRFFNELILEVKDRIYEEEYDENLANEVKKISNKHYQLYSNSIDEDVIDKIISEELVYLRKEVFERPYFEKNDFNEFFSSFYSKTKRTIDSFIANMNTYYLPFPGPGFFMDSKKSRIFNDESAYKLTTTPENPNEGKFVFVEKQERRNNAVKGYRRFLQPVCQFENSPINAKDFIVRKEGITKKIGGKWMVSEDNKMKIQFTY